MRVTPHCYAITGLYYIPPWGANSGFITGSEKTLIVDTGSNSISAQIIYGYASCARESNSLLAINTEKHLDHIGGNSFFAAHGLDIYGHQDINRSKMELSDLLEDFTRCTSHPSRREHNEAAILLRGTTIVNPNRRINQDTGLDLGELAINILLSPGHTRTNLSVFVPSEAVLYCGDCIVNEFIPNLEGGTASDWIDWLKSLARIESIDPRVVVPGHGDIITGKVAIAAEIGRIKAVLHQAIDSGVAPTR